MELEFIDNFDTLCYTLMVSSAITAMIGSVFRVQAYKHHQASSLGILKYLNYAVIFAVDVVVFHSTYSTLSIASMVIVLLASIAQSIFSIRAEDKRRMSMDDDENYQKIEEES